jgi:hypothetical protein
VITVVASSVTGTSRKTPPKRPTGVRSGSQMIGQVALHRRQRPGTGLVLGVDLGLWAVDPEARPGPQHREIGLVVVLLEEHPLEHLRALVAVGRQVLRPLGEVEQDRAGLRQRPAVVEDQRRDPQGRVERADQLRPAGAVADAQLVAVERDPQRAQQEPDLVAVARP